MEKYLIDITNKVEKYVGDELGNLLEYILNSDIFFGRIRAHIICYENNKWYGMLEITSKTDLENIKNKTLLNSKIVRVEPFSKRAYKINIEKNYEQEKFLKEIGLY